MPRNSPTCSSSSRKSIKHWVEKIAPKHAGQAWLRHLEPQRTIPARSASLTDDRLCGQERLRWGIFRLRAQDDVELAADAGVFGERCTTAKTLPPPLVYHARHEAIP
jgi:hypothetical protein